jgi:hypothetical protein
LIAGVSEALRPWLSEPLTRSDAPIISTLPGASNSRTLWLKRKLRTGYAPPIYRFSPSFADEGMATYLKVDKQRFDASQDYRSECFYNVFPATVHSGEKHRMSMQQLLKKLPQVRGWILKPHALDEEIVSLVLLDWITRGQEAVKVIVPDSVSNQLVARWKSVVCWAHEKLARVHSTDRPFFI